MQYLYGIVPSADGSFVQVKISETNGRWSVDSINRREINSTLLNALMLNKKVLLGIESQWVHNQVPDYLNLKSAKTSFGEFYACTQKTNYTLYSEAIEKNLGGVYPDDAYLCTIPIHYFDRISHSFITIAADSGAYKVGIIIQLQLVAVFTVSLADVHQIKGFLSRIKRYWNSFSVDKQFPGTIAMLNMPEISPDGAANIKRLTLYKDDISVVKAIGVALCEIEDGVPSFGAQTDACQFRTIRSVTMLASASLILLTLTLLAISALLNVHYHNRMVSSELEYNAIIDQNKDIRELFKDGAVLSERLARFDSIGARRSSWTKLLFLIGSQKPDGLYIERIGSEKALKSNDYKIAIAGWSVNETSVTEMLKKLNSSTIVTNASLQNMQQDVNKKNLYTFKILCQLKSVN